MASILQKTTGTSTNTTMYRICGTSTVFCATEFYCSTAAVPTLKAHHCKDTDTCWADALNGTTAHEQQANVRRLLRGNEHESDGEGGW